MAASRRPMGPLQLLQSLLTTALLIMALALAWLVGSQVVRRLQSSTVSTSTPVVVVPSSPGGMGGQVRS